MRFVTMSLAMVAIFGSLVGALGSSVSTWISQRRANERDLLGRRVFYRVQLYSEFITESTRILVDALESNFNDPNKLIPAFALLSRIRLTSSKEVFRERRRTDTGDRQKLQRAEPHTRGDTVQSLGRRRSAEAFQRHLSR
jgi:hypothetical protein